MFISLCLAYHRRYVIVYVSHFIVEHIDYLTRVNHVLIFIFVVVVVITVCACQTENKGYLLTYLLTYIGPAYCDALHSLLLLSPECVCVCVCVCACVCVGVLVWAYASLVDHRKAARDKSFTDVFGDVANGDRKSKHYNCPLPIQEVACCLSICIFIFYLIKF